MNSAAPHTHQWRLASHEHDRMNFVTTHACRCGAVKEVAETKHRKDSPIRLLAVYRNLWPSPAEKRLGALLFSVGIVNHAAHE